jgi:hypothetical protein
MRGEASLLTGEEIVGEPDRRHPATRGSSAPMIQPASGRRSPR